MPTFTDFSNLLPDPVNKINAAGALDSSGSTGPGFAKVKFSSSHSTNISRTISGRGVGTTQGSHFWEFSINYNPMTRDEFEPVSTFLETRRGRLYPFYVILPQHAAPRDSAFATWCAANLNGVTVSELHTAGSSSILIDGIITGNPSPGDFITLSDSSDINHTKAYKIVRVETSTTYKAGTVAPTSTQRRIHISPPLVRSASSGTVVNFIDPKFRVVQKGDTMEYDLDTDNLYQFSLSLEEIQP